MSSAFEALEQGHTIDGPVFSVSRESIRDFCEASLDFNPLHWDDDYMKGSFGKTKFDGVIMHGMTNFGLITRMLTYWLYPLGGVHRRLETRWKMPVKPGDSIQPVARISKTKQTKTSRWVLLDIEVKNQRGETVAIGEAMAEFPAPA